MAVPKYFDSAGDMKSHLQTLLDEKEQQLQQAGTLGQRVLAQQMELEERIRQLQELDADKDDEEELDPESRERYRELAEMLVAWDAENAQLSSAFGKSSSSPSMPVSEPPREEPERMKASASTSAAQSRRAKNAAHRADDVEFAFEIGSGLLNEVRRLQSLLGERDKAIQDMKEEKDDLEASIESLRTALKQQEQSADKFKEENWNLEVTLQDLRTQLSNSQSSVARLESEHKRLNKLLASFRDTSEQYKNENTQLQATIEEMTAKHETDVALSRKHAAGLARDKSDLQQTVDTLKAEVARAGRRFPRGSPMTPNGSEANNFLTPGGTSGYGDDVFSNPASTNTRRGKTGDVSMLGGYDDEFGNEFPDSPDASPLNRTSPFRAANHPNNEIEALQQRLAHAQRQISTLKGTLQREKKEKLELKRKFGIDGPEDENEIDFEDEVGDDTVAANVTAGEINGKRRQTPFKVGSGRTGVRGRMRGSGRGGRGRGMTLQERLHMAAHEHDEEGFSPERDTSPLPPIPAIPIRLSDADEEGAFDAQDAYGGMEDGEEEDQVPDEIDFQASPSPVPSNRNSVASVTSIEGMDPAFANVLRRTPSTSSVQASPLRNSLLHRSARGRGGAGTGVGAGRRSRGGAAYHDGRPPSLADQPEDLAKALGGSVGGSPMSIRESGSGTDIMEELGAEIIETAEFGCQTDPEPEPVKEPEPEFEPVPVVPEKVMVDMGVQHEPEPVPPPPPAPVMVEISTQTVPEPVVERDEVAVQHEPRLVSVSMSTEPPVMAEVEVQTLKHVEDEMLSRRTTITQHDISVGSSHGDSTIMKAPGRAFLAAMAAGEEAFDEEEDDGEETETGADTETDTDNDYQDARQSIMMSTPGGTSQDDFHSMMTMTDNDVSDGEEDVDDTDDAESIKVSRLPSRTAQRASVASSASLALGEKSSFYGTPASSAAAVAQEPQVTYDSKSIEVDLVEPPKVEPKPELKEMSIQTDEWTPSVPFPAAAPIPSSPVMYRVGSTKQQFQLVPPAPPPAAPPSSASVVPSPTSSVFKETSTGFATIIKQRPSEDHRQSMDSAASSVIDDGASTANRPRVPSGNTLVDKSKPPMMTLPPPPRAPPPPGSMPPPSFIPERRIPTNSTGSYDMPPPRPSSPPPPELIQRATTPTFGSALSVPGGRGSGFALRQHGSSMPPSQSGLRQPPSTSSFRSAANAASYSQHGLHPSSQVSFKERRELSTTSLTSERSMASPRSSMSSDHHPYLNRNNQNVNPNGVATPNKTLLAGDPAGLVNRSQVSNPTDPAIIHAITQTMIGEFLYKYTRKAIGKGHGTARHRRFFWVHPYTKTLYWSSADPNSTNVAESSAKSAYIEGVRQVLDPNPMPPGLYQYSVVVSTPQREMKFTAPTKERHEIWLNSLKYLLARPSPSHITSPGNATVVPESPVTGDEFMEDEQHLGVNTSPRSQRSGRSMRKDTWNTTPRGKRSRSQLSVGGSIGRRAGTPAAEYLRWNGPESPYSPSKSFVDVHGNDDEDDEDLDFELHGDSLSDEGFEGLENVRACCDGRHTVGHSGKHHHHHHHHHHDGSQNGDHTGSSGPVRPVSPSAWSFRSRTGSANSHEGGTASSFFSMSWSKARTEDGKLRFGSRRSNKTVPTQAP